MTFSYKYRSVVIVHKGLVKIQCKLNQIKEISPISNQAEIETRRRLWKSLVEKYFNYLIPVLLDLSKSDVQKLKLIGKLQELKGPLSLTSDGLLLELISVSLFHAQNRKNITEYKCLEDSQTDQKSFSRRSGLLTPN
eukprot:TRINITY_DN13682_c0_g1_i1.p1 TRINITY_DN13682_c0_g1~~TRINITY_DN13682_c0_g1_i1.p1  ORF type:complete len:137 (+),score=7.99 TRINITY_DN13682_c0_g1_i1:95-505(+)